MGLAVLALLLAGAAIVLIGWLGYQLMGQYGRLLLRVEDLERSLGDLEAATTSLFDSGSPGQQAEPLPSESYDSVPVGLPVGTVLHEFELPDLNGRLHLRSEWHGQRLLLTFVNPACPPSRALLADLAIIGPAPAPSRPLPLLVSTGPPEANRQMLDESGLAATLLLQEEMEVGSLFEVVATPMAYLVDEDGRTASPLAAGRLAILGLAASSRMVGPDDLLTDTTPAPVNGARYQDGLMVGATAPDFRLPSLASETLALSQFQGRPVLLVFCDQDCPPCEHLMPELESIHRAAARLAVVVVSRGDVASNRAWATRHGLTMPVGVQQHWDVSRQYGLLAAPVAYLLDERGILTEPVAAGVSAILDLAARARQAGITHD